MTKTYILTCTNLDYQHLCVTLVCANLTDKTNKY